MTLKPKSLIFFMEEMREAFALSFSHVFNKKYWHIWDINFWKFNETLNIVVVSFEQPGPVVSVLSILPPFSFCSSFSRKGYYCLFAVLAVCLMNIFLVIFLDQEFLSSKITVIRRVAESLLRSTWNNYGELLFLFTQNASSESLLRKKDPY